MYLQDYFFFFFFPPQLKIERLEKHPLSGFGLVCEGRERQHASQRNCAVTQVTVSFGSSAYKPPRVCLGTTRRGGAAGRTEVWDRREGWDAKVKRGTLCKLDQLLKRRSGLLDAIQGLTAIPWFYTS